MLNVPAAYYYFQEDQSDLYGYVKHGLCEGCRNPTEVLAVIEDVQKSGDVRGKARRYCHTIGGPFDGNSQGLGVALLEDMVSGINISPAKWRPLPDGPEGVFEPFVGPE